MRSGVRIPFHLEVAEVQRVADEKERLRLQDSDQREKPLLSSAGAIDPADLLKMSERKLSETAISAEVKTSTLLQSPSLDDAATLVMLNQPTKQQQQQQQQKQEQLSSAVATATTTSSTPTSISTSFSSSSSSDDHHHQLTVFPGFSRQKSELELQIEQDGPAPPLVVGTAPITRDSIFQQTPADPPTLSDFETLNKMATVPRYDAFYQAPRVALKPFHFSWRWKYCSLPRRYSIGLEKFIAVDEDMAISVAHAFTHPDSGTTVTLLPVVHVARPRFWGDADDLCCQHHSVLMEGRYSPTSCDISVVPPRARWLENRPEEDADAEGWEPPADRPMTHWRQPYTWGVKDSKAHTIVHAADSYDYEKFPLWAVIRHNMPVMGDFRREKHCLNILHQLTENGYESFVVPWGVAHMPVFSKMLIQNGFQLTSTSRIVMFDRVDGPTSAAYVRKLRSTISLGRRISDGLRVLGGLSLVWLWGYSLGYSSRDILDYEDLADLGMDSQRRRAWDKAMQPTAGQNKLRLGGMTGPI